MKVGIVILAAIFVFGAEAGRKNGRRRIRCLRVKCEADCRKVRDNNGCYMCECEPPCAPPKCEPGCVVQEPFDGPCPGCDCKKDEEIEAQVNGEVTTATVCTEPSCPIGCTIQTSDNGTCAVCECKSETEEEDFETKFSNCTKQFQSEAVRIYKFFKIKLRNFTCEELFDQYEDDSNGDGTYNNETNGDMKLSAKCIAGTFFVTEVARYFGLKVNVTCIDYDRHEDETIIEYDQSTECKLRQFFAAQASLYFNLKVRYTCNEDYGESYYDVNYGELGDRTTAFLKESNAENKTSNNCKLKKFVGAYKVKNLNSKDNEECEDDDEEKENDLVANSDNQDSVKNKLTTNCKLRKFVGAYKVKNLNSEENEDCEDEEEEVDDDIDVNNDKQDSDNDKPSTNCKLRKFMGAYKVKNLNSEENEDCDDEEEELDDDIDVNNDKQDSDNDKPIDEAITTIRFDEEETTHSIDEKEMTEVVDGNEKTKPNAIRCKLRQFLAAHISKHFNAKSTVDCDNEDEEDYEE